MIKRLTISGVSIAGTNRDLIFIEVGPRDLIPRSIGITQIGGNRDMGFLQILV